MEGWLVYKGLDGIGGGTTPSFIFQFYIIEKNLGIPLSITELPPKLRRARGSDKESTATCQNHQKTTINNSKKMQSVCC